MKTPTRIDPSARLTFSASRPSPLEYYGAATVLQTEPGRVYLEMPDAYTWAELATGWFYEPSPGDRVLAIGGASGWFVIGVLECGETCRVTLPGSLEVSAPAGSISLRSTEEVTIRGKALRFYARDVELVAQKIWERCDSLVQKVRGALRLDAGTTEHRITGDSAVHAGSIRTTSVGDMKLRGKTINLN